MLAPSEQNLEKLGYTRFKSTLKEYCDFFYERRIKDSLGTRYFVKFWHYSAPVDTDTWMFEITLYEPDSTMQIHNPKSIEFCEVRAASFWRLMGSIYYEQDNND